MKITEEQRKEFTDLAIPLIPFIRDNFHPHVKAIVDNESVEIVEGIASGRLGWEDDE